MDFSNHPLNRQQYSNSNKTNLTNSNSTVPFNDIVRSLSDIIPDDDYRPFYASKYKELGHKRYMWLATKARSTGSDPARLFFWMLKNPDAVH